MMIVKDYFLGKYEDSPPYDEFMLQRYKDKKLSKLNV